MLDRKSEVHVVSHTHWDREWYRSFEEFRYRLVGVVDKLIEVLDADPEYRCFMLDGQTVVLEDYLEIRPEREADLRRLVQAGRIQIGPWYILPDEFLVSGESTVRNMLLGWKVARRFGEPMLVGYIPDTFGHLAQMPQILRGFGIDTAVFWRGLSGGPDKVRSEFVWEASDGSSVLAVHLPDQWGYSSLADLEPDVEGAAENVRRKLAIVVAHATTPYVLLMNGTDHLAPMPWLPSILRGVNDILEDATLVHSSFPEFLARVKASVHDLRVYRQEFRDTNRNEQTQWNYILAGVLSARMYLKQANQRCETALEGWVEPFAAMAWKLGDAYPAGFVEYAWRTLLKNHPHDSICGCSIDEVHREMETRFEKVEQLSAELTARALTSIAGRVDAGDVGDGESALVAFNPLGWSRTDLVTAQVHSDLEFVRGVEVRDTSGVKVPARVLSVERGSGLPPYRGQGHEVTFCFSARDVPAVGYRAYTYRLLERPTREGSGLKVGSRWAENEHLRLEVETDGSLTIADKATRRVYAGLNVIEDGGDVGDEYTYAAPTEDKVILSTGQPCRISLVDDGPAKATFLVECDLALPEGESSPDGRARSDRLVVSRVQSWVTLAEKARRVEIETRIDNRSRDHRLRALFRSGVEARESQAETAFDVLSRPVQPVQPGEEWTEDAPAYNPQASFADVSDGAFGLAVANQGLPEFEAKPDGTIALTLVRAVGWLSRISTARVGHAGPPRPTPEGQCLREMTFRYSIIPHAGDWARGRVHQEAHAHLAPMRAVSAEAGSGELPDSKSFLDLGCDDLVLSSIKKAEAGDGIVVRAFNPTDGAVQARIKPGFAWSSAFVANLAEVAQSELSADENGTLQVEVKAHEILTLTLD